MRLTGQAGECRRLAAQCRREATRLKDPMFHRQMIRLAECWEALGDRFELAEDVSGFLQWDAQRLQPPDAFR